MTFRMFKTPAQAAADVAAREASDIDQRVLAKAVDAMERDGDLSAEEAQEWRDKRNARKAKRRAMHAKRGKS